MRRAMVITGFQRNFHNYRDGVDGELREILQGILEILAEREDVQNIGLEEMRRYDCLIFYCAPTWTLKATDPFAVALALYLAEGGRILLLHIMSFGGFTEGAQIFGGAFRMHPPYQTYRFLPVAGTPITEGVGEFMIEDEAHLLYTDRLLRKEILLYALNDDGRIGTCEPVPHQDIYAKSSGMRIPLAWKYRFGLGKLLYSCPGHKASSFKVPEYRRFLQNAAHWLLEME